MEKATATISGVNKRNGLQFNVSVQFTMIPPKECEAHYGTGYYMLVEFPDGNYNYVDVRYDKSTDVKVHAERFIKNYWGDNLGTFKLF